MVSWRPKSRTIESSLDVNSSSWSTWSFSGRQVFNQSIIYVHHTSSPSSSAHSEHFPRYRGVLDTDTPRTPYLSYRLNVWYISVISSIYRLLASVVTKACRDPTIKVYPSSSRNTPLACFYLVLTAWFHTVWNVIYYALHFRAMLNTCLISSSFSEPAKTL